MDDRISKTFPELSGDDTIRLAEIFHLIGDPSRLGLLVRCLGGPVPAGKLAAAAGLTPSLASHHLRLLKAARLVRAERHGREIRYQVDDEHVRHVLRDMIVHMSEDRDG